MPLTNFAISKVSEINNPENKACKNDQPDNAISTHLTTEKKNGYYSSYQNNIMDSDCQGP